MKQESGKLIIDKNGKLILVMTEELANAVCSEPIEEINISIGGGSSSIMGQKRKVNLRFGKMILYNYDITVINGTNNLIGIPFFQNANIFMCVDFKKDITVGGLVTNDRRLARAIGKVAHCITLHKTDITRSNEPCPICGEKGE